jgi:hypothetical protein
VRERLAIADASGRDLVSTSHELGAERTLPHSTFAIDEKHSTIRLRGIGKRDGEPEQNMGSAAIAGVVLARFALAGSTPSCNGAMKV